MNVLYALLVAINDYTTSPLHGCIIDQREVKKYLQEFCEKSRMSFSPLILINNEATRENVITAFEHFYKAGPNDICLFFFAGHGSLYPVPVEYKHLEPDKKLETIVCYDSRSKGGKDIFDKELSYLIWQVSQKNNNKLPFISITDCCHSGSLRGNKSELTNENIRLIRASDIILAPHEMYGYENYQKFEGKVSPPIARRIHLGASRDSETAKEVIINGKTQGVFTYSLIKALKEKSGLLSYNELIRRVNLTVKKAVSNQSSQLLSTFTKDQYLIFLRNYQASNQHIYLVQFNQKYGWTIDAGYIHGIVRSSEGMSPKFKIIGEDKIIEVSKVHSSFSEVTSMMGVNQNLTFGAVLEMSESFLFNIVFAEGFDNELKRDIVRKLSAKSKKANFIKETDGNIDFLIKQQNGKLQFYSKGSETVLKEIVQIDDDSLRGFTQSVTKILHWNFVLKLQPEKEMIHFGEVEILLKKVMSIGDYQDEVDTVILDWTKPQRFEYKEKNGKLYQPAFQLNIKNLSGRELSVSLLYLSADYGVTNQLIQMQVLEHEQDVWALDYDHEGKSYLTIPVQLEDNYFNSGVSTIREYIKVIICTAPFDTSILNQDGILDSEKLDHQQRSLSSRRTYFDENSNWKTIEIPIDIYRC